MSLSQLSYPVRIELPNRNTLRSTEQTPAQHSSRFLAPALKALARELCCQSGAVQLSGRASAATARTVRPAEAAQGGPVDLLPMKVLLQVLTALATAGAAWASSSSYPPVHQGLFWGQCEVITGNVGGNQAPPMIIWCILVSPWIILRAI